VDKVIVRTRALSQALFSLATAGCDIIGVSIVEHAVKVEGVRGEEGELLTLHVWSREAEDTEAEVGKGQALTEDEIKLLDQGKCPKCNDAPQLYKGLLDGLALIVSCSAGHSFWVPPLPFLPEYRGEREPDAKDVEEIKEAVKELKEEPSEQANDLPDVPTEQ